MSALHVEDAAVHQGVVALAGPPQVSVASLLETTGLTAFQRLDNPDGDLEVSLPGSQAELSSSLLGVAKRTVDDTAATLRRELTSSKQRSAIYHRGDAIHVIAAQLSSRRGVSGKSRGFILMGG